ncbi:MAG TPA: hypothetical protein VKH81_23180 [Candidatus Angelobacter sp.]|nr:hypothetical protein [Candidatus Angelobacter sp.]
MFLFLILLGSLQQSQRGTGAAGHNPELGKVVFTCSCSARAQEEIARGVALLHSFQYQEANATFTDAAAREPSCAMAHWGIAMANTRLLWHLPGAGELDAGLNQATLAERLLAPTDRERRYIAAAAAFFQDDVKLPYARRVLALKAVLGNLASKYPEDVDAQAFYALSLVTLAHLEARGSMEELSYRQQALDILEPLFAKNPDHPGLAHYIIHAADTSTLASRGIEAARRYAAIAPSSPHALHMPSHIFFWLGMWKEAAACNLAAAHAGQEATLEAHGSADYTLHAMDFLDYSYLQGGSMRQAQRLTTDLANVPGAPSRQLEFYRTLLDARNSLELHQWRQAASLPDPSPVARSRGFAYFVRAVGAARSGNIDEAKKQLDKLVQLQDSVLWNQVQFEEAEAWLDHAEGKNTDAIALLRSASEDESVALADSLLMPAREMLADLLLELNRPEEALAEYKVVLSVNRNRFDALSGAIRAAHNSGRNGEAAQLYSTLLSGVLPDADRPELDELKALLPNPRTLTDGSINRK